MPALLQACALLQLALQDRQGVQSAGQLEVEHAAVSDLVSAPILKMPPITKPLARGCHAAVSATSCHRADPMLDVLT